MCDLFGYRHVTYIHVWRLRAMRPVIAFLFRTGVEVASSISSSQVARSDLFDGFVSFPFFLRWRLGSRGAMSPANFVVPFAFLNACRSCLLIFPVSYVLDQPLIYLAVFVVFPHQSLPWFPKDKA